MDLYQVATAGVLTVLAAGGAKFVGRRTSSGVGWLVFVLGLLAIQPLNARFVGPWMRAARVERELLSSPVLRAMKEGDPATYEKAVSIARQAAQTGRSEADISAEVQGLWAARINEYLLRASDEAVVAYYGSVVRRLEDLRSDPGICQNLLAGKNTADLAPHVSSETNNITMSATALLIQTSAGRVEPRAIDHEEAARDLGGAVEAVVQSDADAELLRNPAGRGSDGYRACELYAQMYRAVLRLPDGRAAAALRTLVMP